MGARPLRRAIQRYIEDPLADEVLKTPMTPGSTVLVERDDGAREKSKEDGGPDEELKITILAPVDKPPEEHPVPVGGDGESSEPSDDQGEQQPEPSGDG
jgi:ATP-dependent Clp protease ATP-binding subunit ClpC